MPKLNGAQWAEKQGRRLKAALPDIRTGIERVTEPPGAKAAAAQDRMRTNLVASIDSGKWARNVGGVSLQEWKKSAIDKGLNRISAGVDGAMAKNAIMGQKLMDAVAGGQSAIASIPRGDFSQNLERMTRFVTHMHDNPIK